jgi:hypothetical protein
MQLTRFQYKALKLYRRYHTGGFTPVQVLRIFWKQWALFIGCAVVGYCLLSPSSPALGCLAVGMFCGAILRDFGHCQVAFRLWPVNREIYDWKKVEDFIESYERAAQTDQRQATPGSRFG